MTEGFSCSDMAILVKTASYVPYNEAKSCKYFKKVKVNNEELWMPCKNP